MHNARNKVLAAYRFNFLQLIFGVIFACLFGRSAIIGVLAFALAQYIFTRFAFSSAGAISRQKVFKGFVIGELLKIIVLVLVSLLFSKLLSMDFFSYILGLVSMQLAALFVPLLFSRWL